jgi:hypothetical protein
MMYGDGKEEEEEIAIKGDLRLELWETDNKSENSFEWDQGKQQIIL